MALAARRAKQLPKEPGLAFCYDMLNRVSRRCAGESWLGGSGAVAVGSLQAAFPTLRSRRRSQAALAGQPRCPPRCRSSLCPAAPAPTIVSLPTTLPPSFAVVIQQLPDGLRDAVCVFYLVLRALDTVEVSSLPAGGEFVASCTPVCRQPPCRVACPCPGRLCRRCCRRRRRCCWMLFQHSSTQAASPPAALALGRTT